MEQLRWTCASFPPRQSRENRSWRGFRRFLAYLPAWICTLFLAFWAAAWLLHNGGRLCCVFPAARMLELIDAMNASRITPKRLRLAHSRADMQAHLCLLEGKLDARPGLTVEPPLVIYKADGEYTDEMKGIYGIGT